MIGRSTVSFQRPNHPFRPSPVFSGHAARKPPPSPPARSATPLPAAASSQVPIHAGDQLRFVDLEGMQACEVVAVDAAGAADPDNPRGARPDGDATGLKQILRGDRRERAIRCAPGLSGAASTSPKPAPSICSAASLSAGDDAHFTVTRDGLLIVAAPGGAMARRRAGHGNSDPGLRAA